MYIDSFNNFYLSNWKVWVTNAQLPTKLSRGYPDVTDVAISGIERCCYHYDQRIIEGDVLMRIN